MTVYGNTSRVSVETVGGGIAAVTGGDEQKAVMFARGDPNNGSASANEPTRVSGPGNLGPTFGADTPIVEYMQDVAGNGIGYSQLWGVMPEQTQTQDEDITDGGDAADHTGGSKINGGDPIVEDKDLITVEDGSSTEMAVEFRYETNTDSTSNDFTQLSPSEDTLFINRNTGEWVADAADNYTITYESLDWSAAFDAAVDVVQEQERGVWLLGSEAESVVSTANAKKSPLRNKQWKMVNVLGVAEPNATGDDDGAQIDVTSYDDGIDDEATFLFGPARKAGGTTTAIGAVGGVAASNAIDDPIIGEALSGVTDLEQTLNVADQESLESVQVAPLSNAGSPSIEGNLSTDTSSSWLVTWFSRNLADFLILAARAVAQATRGSLNNDMTETIVEQQVTDEIEELIDDGVLRPNTESEERWYVAADQDPTNNRELDVDIGFTPTGVVDVVDVTQTINY